MGKWWDGTDFDFLSERFQKNAQNNDLCDVCEKRGELLCCDGPCLRSFHLTCLGIKETDVPDGDWTCAACAALSPRARARDPAAALARRVLLENGPEVPPCRTVHVDQLGGTGDALRAAHGVAAWTGAAGTARVKGQGAVVPAAAAALAEAVVGGRLQSSPFATARVLDALSVAALHMDDCAVARGVGDGEGGDGEEEEKADSEAEGTGTAGPGDGDGDRKGTGAEVVPGTDVGSAHSNGAAGDGIEGDVAPQTGGDSGAGVAGDSDSDSGADSAVEASDDDTARVFRSRRLAKPRADAAAGGEAAPPGALTAASLRPPLSEADLRSAPAGSGLVRSACQAAVEAVRGAWEGPAGTRMWGDVRAAAAGLVRALAGALPARTAVANGDGAAAGDASPPAPAATVMGAAEAVVRQLLHGIVLYAAVAGAGAGLGTSGLAPARHVLRSVAHVPGTAPLLRAALWRVAAGVDSAEDAAERASPLTAAAGTGRPHRSTEAAAVLAGAERSLVLGSALLWSGLDVGGERGDSLLRHATAVAVAVRDRTSPEGWAAWLAEAKAPAATGPTADPTADAACPGRLRLAAVSLLVRWVEVHTRGFRACVSPADARAVADVVAQPWLAAASPAAAASSSNDRSAALPEPLSAAAVACIASAGPKAPPKLRSRLRAARRRAVTALEAALQLALADPKRSGGDQPEALATGATSTVAATDAAVPTEAWIAAEHGTASGDEPGTSRVCRWAQVASLLRAVAVCGARGDTWRGFGPSSPECAWTMAREASKAEAACLAALSDRYASRMRLTRAEARASAAAAAAKRRGGRRRGRKSARDTASAVPRARSLAAWAEGLVSLRLPGLEAAAEGEEEVEAATSLVNETGQRALRNGKPPLSRWRGPGSEAAARVFVRAAAQSALASRETFLDWYARSLRLRTHADAGGGVLVDALHSGGPGGPDAGAGAGAAGGSVSAEDIEELFAFDTLLGTVDDSLAKAVIEDVEVDLHSLFLQVARRGGAARIASLSAWFAVASAVNVGAHVRQKAEKVRGLYLSSLLRFERFVAERLLAAYVVGWFPKVAKVRRDEGDKPPPAKRGR